MRLLSVVFAVSAISFLMLNLLPGDPTLALLGPSAGDPRAKAELTKQLALGRPLPVRYVTWLGHAVRGDLGRSYFTHQTVSESMLERLPLTVELMAMALFIALVVAVPIALAAARSPGGWFDRVTSTGTLALLGLPPFMLGILLIYLFTLKIHAFPASGISPWFHVGTGVVATPRSILLPAVTLAAGQLAVFARVLRADLLTTLRSDFIMFARAKGLTDRQIMIRHALRPSVFSIMTLAALSIGGLVGGAVIVENMFALPGMGRLIVTSIYKRDYLIVQASVVMTAVTFVFMTIAVELLYVAVDPRLRAAATR